MIPIKYISNIQTVEYKADSTSYYYFIKLTDVEKNIVVDSATISSSISNPLEVQEIQTLLTFWSKKYTS